MSTLTIATIRENPWNVITHGLPEHPEVLLLGLAQLAADYCRKSEQLCMQASSAGVYFPLSVTIAHGFLTVRHESKAKVDEAENKLAEIRELFLREFGDPLDH
jgi:hypothetical protein